MTWHAKMVCRILLMVAQILAHSDPELAQELRYLSNSISQYREENTPEDRRAA